MEHGSKYPELLYWLACEKLLKEKLLAEKPLTEEPLAEEPLAEELLTEELITEELLVLTSQQASRVQAIHQTFGSIRPWPRSPHRCL